MKKRFLSMLICLTMLLGTIPISASAEESSNKQENEIQTEELLKSAAAAGTADEERASFSDDEETPTISPDTANIFPGQSAEFTVTYNGTEELTVYLQKGATESRINASYTQTEPGVYKVTVTTKEDLPANSFYYLHVYPAKKASKGVTVTVNILEPFAKDDKDNYYSDMESALAGVQSGGTLTILSSVQLPRDLYIPDDTDITLDLNGKSLSGYALEIGGYYRKNSKLTVIDSSNGNGSIGLEVRDNGTLIFAPENAATKILQLSVYGGDVELRGGSIRVNKWTFDDNHTINLTKLLAPGYAYRDYYGYDCREWVKLSELTGRQVSRNFDLAIQKCIHQSIQDNICEYCGKQIVAQLGADSYFVDFEEALKAAQENPSQTLKLLCDISGSYTINNNATIDLNGKTINGTLTVKGGIVNFLNGKIDKVIMNGGAEFGEPNETVSGAVIGTLTIAQGANLSAMLTNAVLKKHNNDDTTTLITDLSAAEYENVSIERAPITSNNANVKINGTDKSLSGNNTVSVNQAVTFSTALNPQELSSNGTVKFFLQAADSTTVQELTARYDTAEKKYVSDYTFSEVNEYTVWCEASQDGYTLASEKGKITVNAADISNAVITINNSESLVFTPDPDDNAIGKDISLDFTVTSDGTTLLANTDYKIISGEKGNNAGNYTLTIQGIGKYSGTKELNWTIAPHKLNNISVTQITKKYDGTTNLPAGVSVEKFISADGDIVLTNSNYKLSGSFDSAAPGSTNATLQITLLTDNYIFANGKSEESLTVGATIAKADKPQVENGKITIIKELKKDYSYDVKTLLPNLDYGTKTYEISLVDIVSYYDESEPASISQDGILTLPIQEKQSSYHEAGTVLVTVKSDNYDDITLTINIYARSKIVPKIPEGMPKLSTNEITYGEPIGKITLSGYLYDNENKVNVEGTFSWSSPDLTITSLGLRQVQWKFTPNNPEYETVRGYALVTVKKANSEYSALPTPMTDLTYSGTAQSLLETNGSTEHGTIQYSLNKNDWDTNVPMATEAKTYKVYYKIVGDSAHNDSEVQYVEAKISPMPLIYTAKYTTKIYDGTTAANVESIKFYNKNDQKTEIALSNTDYIVNSAAFTSPNAGTNCGKTNIVLKNANYSIDDSSETSASGGQIKPALIENCNDSTVYIRYNDTSLHEYGASLFGNLKDENYDIFSSQADAQGSEIIDSASVINKKIAIQLKDGLTSDDVGKTYTVSVRIMSSDKNYCTDSDEKDTLTFKLEIIDRTEPILSLNPISKTYDGNAASLQGTATVDGKKIDGIWAWENSAPVNVIDSGKHTVKFTPNDTAAYKPATATVDVTINPMSINDKAVTIALTIDSFIYNGSTQKPTVTAAMNGISVLEDTDYMLTWPKDIVNFGEKEITIRGIGNFKDEITKTYKIEKANSSIETEPQAVANLIYNGNAQALITDGTATGGTMQYKLADGTWQDTIPTALNADSYTVLYKVTGDQNHNDSSEGSITAAIAAKDITNAAIGNFEKMTYNGASQTPKADVTVDGLPVTGSWSSVINVSDTTTFTADGNFSGKYENAATGMDAKDIEKAVLAPKGTLTYNGQEQTQDITVALDDLTVTYDISGNKATNVKTGGDYTLTVKGNNNFKGEITLDWNILPAEPKEDEKNKTKATVRRGRKLSEASVTTGEMLGIDDATLDGTFAWADESTTVNSNGKEPMIFTPTDTNYKAVTIDVEVDTYSSNGSISSTVRHTVSFDTNGGSVVTSQTIKKNGIAAEPAAPTKEGFDFAGWYTDKELNNKYDFSQKVTKSFTLYAAWTKTGTEPSDKPSNPDSNNQFDDVNKDDWYYDDVKDATDNGLFKGTGDRTFTPNGLITRGMFVTVLYRAEGEPAVNKSIPFADVSADSYYANAVIWAEQNGIVEGISETKFAPNVNITREQIAAVMFRYANYKKYDTTQGGMAIREYDDYTDISEYAVPAMQYAITIGLIKGKTASTLNPKDNATRAEIAAILNRFMKANK